MIGQVAQMWKIPSSLTTAECSIPCKMSKKSATLHVNLTRFPAPCERTFTV